jgi:hypothetical protein
MVGIEILAMMLAVARAFWVASETVAQLDSADSATVSNGETGDVEEARALARTRAVERRNELDG